MTVKIFRGPYINITWKNRDKSLDLLERSGGILQSRMLFIYFCTLSFFTFTKPTLVDQSCFGEDVETRG